MKCEEYKTVAERDESGLATCFKCYNEQLNFGYCDRCNGLGARPSRWNGGLICKKCNREVKLSPRSPAKKEKCFGCGEDRLVNKRKNGKPYCGLCVRTLWKVRLCGVCNEKKIVIYRVGKKPACQRCRKNYVKAQNAKNRSV